MWIFVVLCQLSIIFGSETMIVGPRNAAVIVGQKMEMKCQVDSNCKIREWWIERKFNRTRDVLVSNWNNQNRIINAHFGVDINDFGSAEVLYANSTTLNDAGIYMCSVQQESKQPEHHSANLIVFEAEPLCYSNSTLPFNATIQKETRLWMRCTVNFRGNLIPDIEWRQHEGYGEEYDEGREITTLADTVTIPNSSITSELTVVLNSSAIPLFYTFKMYFRSVNDSQLTNATNAPNYSYIWTTPAVDISSTYLQTDRALILMALAVSLVSATFVAVIIWYNIRRRRHDIASAVRPVNIPDVAKCRQEIQQDPFYAEVTSIERAAVKSEKRTPGSSVTESHDSQNARRLNYFGDDGTEYMEVNAMGRQPMPVRLPTQQNTFSVVGEYAFIDHTLSPPIPPRGKIV